MIPAAVADSWFFWLAIIGVLAGGLHPADGDRYRPPDRGPRLGRLPEHDPGRLACGPAAGLPDATQGDQSRSLPAAATRAVADVDAAMR